MMRNVLALGVAATSLMLTATLQANESQEIDIHDVTEEGVGDLVGTVTLEETEHGVLLTPDISDLAPGVYGFHVHENASCEPEENDDGEMTAAQAAGGHYDPEDTGSHEGPYGEGHLGDLPVLVVDENNETALPVLATRLSLDDLNGRSVMIHEGGDNYSDDPEPLGGGGGRKMCGVIEF